MNILNYLDTKKLPPEEFDGNIEYKLHLSYDKTHKLQKFITQMQWRLSEGFGTCYYIIGVYDDGTIYGITKDEQKSMFKIINYSVSKCNATYEIINEIEIDDKYIMQIKVMNFIEDEKKEGFFTM